MKNPPIMRDGGLDMKPEDRENFLKLEEGRINVWDLDPNLQNQMRMRLDAPTWAWAEETLRQTGDMCGGVVYERARVVDKENHTLRKWSQWGRDVSEFIAHPLYLENVRDLYGGGIVGWNHQEANILANRRAPMELIFGWGYMGAGADIGVYCPICMTHGAYFLLEKFGSKQQIDKYVPRLTSCDPSRLWTGAMLLTEITGGSDVGSSRTVARQRDGKWLITGEKWFSSNAGADVFMVLARPEGAPAGPKGLALFVLPRLKENGEPNNFEIRRIKDKIGTRNVATAEMTFADAEAELVGKAEEGIHYMMEMVNLSRLYNAVGSVGLMARAFIESKRYLAQREAFGALVSSYAPVKERLLDMAVDLEANLAITFEGVAAFERCETGKGDYAFNHRLLRLLTPMCKYVTGEKACDFTREAACFFGGNGTIEDFGIERFYRDSLILPIWEGTANIQVIDVFRAIRKEAAHETLLAHMTGKLGGLESPLAREVGAALSRELEPLKKSFAHLMTRPKEEIGLHSRRMTDRLIAWSQAVCLTAEADWEWEKLGNPRKFLTALRHLHVAVLGSRRDPIRLNDRFALDWHEAILDWKPVKYGEVEAAVKAGLEETAMIG